MMAYSLYLSFKKYSMKKTLLTTEIAANGLVIYFLLSKKYADPDKELRYEE